MLKSETKQEEQYVIGRVHLRYASGSEIGFLGRPGCLCSLIRLLWFPNSSAVQQTPMAGYSGACNTDKKWKLEGKGD